MYMELNILLLMRKTDDTVKPIFTKTNPKKSSKHSHKRAIDGHEFISIETSRELFVFLFFCLTVGGLLSRWFNLHHGAPLCFWAAQLKGEGM